MIDRRRVMGSSGDIKIAEASVGTACAGIKWKHLSGQPFKLPTEVVNQVSGYQTVMFTFRDPNGNFSFKIEVQVNSSGYYNFFTPSYIYNNSWTQFGVNYPWVTDDGEWVTILFQVYHDFYDANMTPETPYYYQGIYSGSSTMAALLNDYVYLIPA